MKKLIELYKEVMPGCFNLMERVTPPKSVFTDLGEVYATAIYKKISGRVSVDWNAPELEKIQPLNHIEVRDGKVFSVSYVQDGLVRENIISQYLGNKKWATPKQY